MKERSKHFQYLSLTHNPSLKDHKLEHAEDLKSWIIIYLKLEPEARLTVQRCWQACAWPGNKPLVLEASWILWEHESGCTFSTKSWISLYDFYFLFLWQVSIKSGTMSIKLTQTRSPALNRLHSCICFTLAQFVILSSIYTNFPSNSLGCRSTAAHKFALKG